MTEILISGLVILLIASNAFWGVVVHKLINKLMSRTFWDYQQAKVIPKTKEQELAEALSNVKIPEKTGPNELDSLDEMIQKMMPLG